MGVTETRDAEFIFSVATEPGMMKLIGDILPDRQIVDSVVHDPRHHFYTDGTGFIAFHVVDNGVFDMHLSLQPDGPMKSVSKVRDAINKLPRFSRIEARPSKPMDGFLRRLGFKDTDGSKTLYRLENVCLG